MSPREALRLVTDDEEPPVDEPAPRPRRQPRHLPLTSTDCPTDPGPCPYVSCRLNTFLEVNPVTGMIQYAHPGLDISEAGETCSKRLADRGGMSMTEVGDVIGTSKVWVFKTEEKAKAKLRNGLIKLLPRPRTEDTRG